ncbi:AraC family transcriptional regulator ligand-binding domain-containing protein [Marivirga sp.]|uniref:helix-turn-helix transcriptional regulator n=1 Tax=Marivirga sp. TaxID=2018662 RepID=UPI003DA6E826
MAKVAAVHQQYLLEYTEVIGINKEQLLKVSNEDNDYNFSLEKGLIDAEQYLLLLSKLNTISNIPNFGYFLGTSLNVRTLGFIAHVQKHAKDFSQAIDILQNYLEHSYAIVDLDVYQESNHLIIKLGASEDLGACQNIVLEAIFNFIIRELKGILPDISFFEKVYIPPSFIPSTLEQLNIPYSFEEINPTIVLSASVLDINLNKKHSVDITSALTGYLALLEKNHSHLGEFSGRVKKMALSMCCPEPPNLDYVASQFFMTKRSFQRKLANEGNTFREIIDAIRQEMSSFLEMSSDLKINDISYLLGYSESSAYLHARNRWNQPIELTKNVEYSELA